MSIRKFVVTGLVIVLIFFYLVPVTFVQGLAELRNLQKWLPVGGIVNIPIVGSFIAGFLPVLILSSAIYVLPGILYYLSYLEGFHSYSKIERAASGKLIFFYVVNTFFASVVSGSVLSELDRFLDAPKLIPERLAVAIPGKISNVYMPTYESGGQFWPQLHNRVIAVLILMQITVMGVLGTKQAVRAAPSMIPLPFLTLYFNKFCTDRFLSCFKKTSLESATAWDVMNHGNHLASNGDLDLQFCADAYQHPAMKPIMSYGERENEAEQPPSPSPVSREDNDNYYPPRNE
ncbi:hypothetical protein CBR_g22016 [Chara braunii]|uniref:CSC1/OSCA1-like 7TM region domain-containing protein n=1 Tax=Chara braunii TaxID=69332 RepID=A0A388L1Y4_CHABU|nr:hypothetical protein CBR_g22016 [Chara braunii]|eukprot:GBG76268.1 hypothetical protein CBR_g22016 [Chara braunii]